MSNEGHVTIRLKVSTREKLRDLGRKGDTYDEIILRLHERARK